MIVCALRISPQPLFPIFHRECNSAAILLVLSSNPASREYPAHSSPAPDYTVCTAACHSRHIPTETAHSASEAATATAPSANSVSESTPQPPPSNSAPLTWSRESSERAPHFHPQVIPIYDLTRRDFSGRCWRWMDSWLLTWGHSYRRIWVGFDLRLVEGGIGGACGGGGGRAREERRG